MIAIVIPTFLAAAGYSRLHMLGRRGLSIAILIFIVTKMLGQ